MKLEKRQPDFETLDNIANVLNTTIAELMGETQEERAVLQKLNSIESLLQEILNNMKKNNKKNVNSGYNFKKTIVYKTKQQKEVFDMEFC